MYNYVRYTMSKADWLNVHVVSLSLCIQYVIGVSVSESLQS